MASASADCPYAGWTEIKPSTTANEIRPRTERQYRLRVRSRPVPSACLLLGPKTPLRTMNPTRSIPCAQKGAWTNGFGRLATTAPPDQANKLASQPYKSRRSGQSSTQVRVSYSAVAAHRLGRVEQRRQQRRRFGRRCRSRFPRSTKYRRVASRACLGTGTSRCLLPLPKTFNRAPERVMRTSPRTLVSSSAARSPGRLAERAKPFQPLARQRLPFRLGAWLRWLECGHERRPGCRREGFGCR